MPCGFHLRPIKTLFPLPGRFFSPPPPLPAPVLQGLPPLRPRVASDGSGVSAVWRVRVGSWFLAQFPAPLKGPAALQPPAVRPRRLFPATCRSAPPSVPGHLLPVTCHRRGERATDLRPASSRLPAPPGPRPRPTRHRTPPAGPAPALPGPPPPYRACPRPAWLAPAHRAPTPPWRPARRPVRLLTGLASGLPGSLAAPSSGSSSAPVKGGRGTGDSGGQPTAEDGRARPAGPAPPPPIGPAPPTRARPHPSARPRTTRPRPRGPLGCQSQEPWAGGSAAISARSFGVRGRVVAVAFSVAQCSCFVPGIGTTWGPRVRSQARAT
jgi:hypothetical protein